MPKRLYLTNIAPTTTAPPAQGGWDQTTSQLTRELGHVKAGTPSTASDTEVSGSNNLDVLLVRFVSPANVVTTAGNLSGELDLVIARQENSTSANLMRRMMVWVTVGTTSAVRGVLFDFDAGTSEWPTTASASTTNEAINTVAVQPGDRIVLEYGFQAQNTSTTPYIGTVWFGGTDAADLVTGDAGTAVATRSPWIQFSDTQGVLRNALAYTPTAGDAAGATDATVASRGRTATGADTAAATDAATPARGRLAGDVAAATDAAPTVVANRDRLIVDRAPALDAVVPVYTRPDIDDFQFVVEEDLARGIPFVPFGAGQTVVVATFDPGTPEVRNQDQASPVADVRWFGVDLRTPPTWAFELYTDVETPDEALSWAQNVADVWEAEAVRSVPNAVVALRYKVAGRVRRVYGRPRRFAVVPSHLRTGRVHIVADFVLAENVFYDDLEESFVVGTVANTVSGTGFTFPVTFPLTIGVQGDSPRVEQPTIGGRKPAWVDVTFLGPSVDPWVMINDRRWSLRGEIPEGVSVRMSGKPWQAGTLRSDGAWASGMLDPRARLSQLRLTPGVYSVRYGAYDPTGTSKARLAWRGAYGTM